MVMRWLMCGLGNMHIIGPCAGCESSRGGVILGTVGYAFRGVVTAKCVDCGKSVDYYVGCRQGADVASEGCGCEERPDSLKQATLERRL